MTIASLKKSKEWTILDLKKVFKNLKINKSRDHEGFINEIFKECVIGTDLRNSLLIMFNKMKNEQLIPQNEYIQHYDRTKKWIKIGLT